MFNLSDGLAHANVRMQLTEQLISHLYGSDDRWLDGGKLVGEPDRSAPRPDLGTFGGQRGLRFI